MKKCSFKYGFEVIEIPEYVLSDIAISSTTIREKINQGELPTANNLLGYEYALTGTITKGNQIGRTIGFPTANLSLFDDLKLIPCNGVYAVYVSLMGNENLGGMMNIGTRPTFDGKDRTIEVHLFDFDKEIYDETLTVRIIQKIRDEKKFSGLMELKEQLQLDQVDCIQLLKSHA
jgi:riboflavin kinase/FMN adenylyltransferase